MQEERDFYFGRLFGLTVLVQSEVLFRATTSPNAINKTVEDFFTLALTKSWLREPSSQALCGLISAPPNLKTAKTIAESIEAKLEASGLLSTQDGAGILLTLNVVHKDIRPTSNKVWHHGDPLHSSNLPLLTKILRETSSEEDAVKQTGGNFKGDAHFVWRLILMRYLESSKNMIKFESLWNNVVESMGFLWFASNNRWIFCQFLILGAEVSWVSAFLIVSSWVT
jgi:DNA polymerase phi